MSGREAGALLVGEEGDGDRVRRGDAVLLERLDDLEPGEHAEVAVEAATGGDGVDVRAAHHRRGRRDRCPAGWRRRCRWRRSPRRARGRASSRRRGRGRPGRRRSGPGGRSPPRRSGPLMAPISPSSTSRAHSRSPSTRRSVPPSPVAVIGRNSNAAISRERGAERVDGAGEQLGAALGRRRRSGRRCGRRRRSRSTASRTRPAPPKRTYRLSARCSGTRRTAADMSTSSGARWSISDVSSVPPWMPMPSSSAGRRPALVRRQAGVGEERHQPVVQAQLAVGDVDERAVAAVAVEEHEPRAGVMATQRPRSSRTASSVDADSQTVPGDQACSFDLV